MPQGILVYKGGIDSIASSDIADHRPRPSNMSASVWAKCWPARPVSDFRDPALRLLAEIPAHLDLTGARHAARPAGIPHDHDEHGGHRSPDAAASWLRGHDVSLPFGRRGRPDRPMPPSASPRRPTASSALLDAAQRLRVLIAFDFRQPPGLALHPA